MRKKNENGLIEVDRLIGADKPQSIPAQCESCPTPGERPSREYGSPQGTVPYPIAHAMEFCLKNCRIAQCTKESIGVADSARQKCRFPLHCSIEFLGHK